MGSLLHVCVDLFSNELMFGVLTYCLIWCPLSLTNAPPPANASPKAEAPSKGKSTSSAPPPKMRNRSEAGTSSQSKGKQVVEAIATSQLRTRGEREYGIKSAPSSARGWYKKCPPNNYHPDLSVEEPRLKSCYPQIWQAIHDLGLGFEFKKPGDANINLIREFSARWNLGDEEQLVPIHGRLINIFATAICNHLEALDVPHALLANFIDQSSYGDIRHTLYGVN